MPRFSNYSKRQLATCDERLQRIAERAIEVVDFRVLEGHRGQEAQHAAFLSGTSKLDWPFGNHNASPSRAFDFAPWPIDWSEKVTALSRFTMVAGVMLAYAHELGIKIRFGWDWNRNFDPRDERFLDWGHVELDEP